ncbi:MAG TPA: hypothetical protein VHX15_16590, partial [Frankiaceae bacterium]|nr:hypothetical protein [Frankiaceae bacterium]
HLLSVSFVGAVATVFGAVLFPGLLRGALRPTLAAIAFTLLLITNLLAGRVTFAVGVALALGSLRLLSAGRAWWAALPAALSGLASPVAALFLGLVAAVLVLFAPGWRKRAFGLGVAATIPVIAVAVLFPDPGRMPFTRDALKPSLYASLGLIPALYGRRARLARWGAVASLVLVLGAYLVTSPIGSNAERFALLWGLPILLAYSPLPAVAVVLVAFPLVWWAERNVGQELKRSRDPSASRSFYTPLLTELEKRWDGTRRVEVIDPRTHWSSAYVAEKIPIARGWERQVDDARNPIFYGRARLDAASYRQFLDQYAVGWVALPDAKLDFAATSEARLVRQGLGYLTPVWHGGAWTLYAVSHPAPLVSGTLSATSVGRSSVQLEAPRAGASGVLQLHWSRWLQSSNGCIGKRGEWTYVAAKNAGPVKISVSAVPARASGCGSSDDQQR